MGTRRLTLLRHGEAQPPDTCPEDFERVLTRRGQHSATEMGTRLFDRGLVPELVVVSPAERAWNTAVLVAQACELDPKDIVCARELYLATPETVWQLIREREPSLHHILICGHNPGLSQLASRFGPHPTNRDLPTAGLATAVWKSGAWDSLEPEFAAHCQFDDPETLAALWTGPQA